MRLFWLQVAVLVILTAAIATNAVAGGIEDGTAGLYALDRGSIDEAIRLFTKAIGDGDLSSDDLEFAYFNRGKAYLAKADHKAAIADLRQAVHLKPDDTEAQRILQAALAPQESNTNGVVRAAVGELLQAALAAAKVGNYPEAMIHVIEAESIGGLSASEQKVISATRAYIEVKSGGSVGVATAAGAQAKFDTDYRAGRFRDAINDEDLLREHGILNATNMIVIGQAYFRMGDYAGCVRYTSSHSEVGQEMLELQKRCAGETR